jgi:uncharacterized membrane protein required for colicin V production
MKSADLSFNWVDLLIGGLLVAGIVRGRKRGMSEELLDVIKWIIIVAAGSFLYEPLGNYLAGSTMFSRLAAYIFIYSAVILGVLLLFSFIRHQIGGKLVGSDVFGSSEYYLGMVAGVVRYACILVVLMSLFHARYFTPDEIRTEIKYQEDVYGSAYFPKPCIVQHWLFAESLTGRLVSDYLGVLLIRSTPPEDKGLGSTSIARTHERNVYDVLEKR